MWRNIFFKRQARVVLRPLRSSRCIISVCWRSSLRRAWGSALRLPFRSGTGFTFGAEPDRTPYSPERQTGEVRLRVLPGCAPLECLGPVHADSVIAAESPPCACRSAETAAKALAFRLGVANSKSVCWHPHATRARWQLVQSTPSHRVARTQTPCMCELFFLSASLPGNIASRGMDRHGVFVACRKV